MTKEYSIFPGQIKINNCTYFGLDYELTDFVNHLAEQNKKYKEAIDKAINDIDLVIELIKQQPTEDDSWILGRLNAFKIILKEVE